MYCTYCGAQNPDDYNFCYKCGKPRPEVGQIPVQPIKAAAPPPPKGRWEYKEFTRQFDDSFNVRADEEGFFVLCSSAELLVKRMEIDLKREGWELAESVSYADLLKNDRVSYEVEEYGLIRKQRLLKAQSVTVKFKRWVE